MTQPGMTVNGWTPTKIELGFDGLVDVTIEKDGTVETFEKCSFGSDVNVMAWAIEQAERRAAVRAQVALIEPAPVEEVVDNGANG